ncbi:hypothetical protein GLOTRDRAFT_93752 [Gloeophyllum trabeum ATCC 11539]|uniref:Uncharacterized protein n=1 Tax=Gloeophyllum trabeum (strain ATCC 11539 / FP-39264 / Madison 617) TaxID=670483 RepID=S7RQR7_GLOTA|nr:uncharacterized protein GLOTRDRAFT_93752 [Gloeophyllum trabeum ATCC 11539]EPQ55254.1 hypothetical protein GLOTRDRAFT_93752 [Gloeophyllum trabeum ATCC 11539]
MRQRDEHWKARLDEAQRRADGLKAALAQRNRSFEELQARYASLERQWQDQAKLLTARTAESQAAQTFLTKADTLSVAEVRSMVGDLNTDIFQTAAKLAELVDLSIRAGGLGAEAQSAQAVLQRWLAKDLYDALATTQDISILQIAIQGVICGCCREIISRWPCSRSQSKGVKEGRECRAIYDTIRAHEVQAVAGRWRSLARGHMRQWDEGGQAEYDHYLPLVTSDVLQVYALTGCVSLEALSSTKGTVFKSLSEIIRFALRIRNTLGEEITSCDLEVVTAPQGQPFNPQCMDEDGGDESGQQDYSSDTQVLCTTQLGLSRTESVSSGGKKYQHRGEIVTNCKVALSSFLQPAEVPARALRDERRRRRENRAQRSDKTSESMSASSKGPRRTE